MKRTITYLCALLIYASTCTAQMAINSDNSDPDISAILDIKSTNLGLLIPRVTLNDVNTAAPVTNPAEGLFIFNINGTADKGLYYWTGSKWQLVGETNSCEVFGNPAIIAEGNSTATSIEVCTGTSLSLGSSTNGKWDNSNPTYSWTGPNSYTSTAADPGEVTASFDIATHAGDYIVTITNGVASGCSYSDTVTVYGSTSTPATPGTITGNTAVCENATESYSIEDVANASSYNWTVPIGSTIQSGQGTTNISVVVGNTSGNISVRAESICNGNSDYNTGLSITVVTPPSITDQPNDLSIVNTNGSNFTITATNVTIYQWQEDQGSGFSNISNGGVYSGATSNTLNISDGTNMDGFQYKCLVINFCNDTTTSDTVLLNWTGNIVHNSTTGEYWIDRNLGASQVATASDHYLAYGNLYQWGRYTEGHEVINWTSSNSSDGTEQSNETSSIADTSAPNLGNSWDGKFITTSANWLSPKNDDLWQGVNGINNPCPSGFRLPTSTEFSLESSTWSTQNAAGAFQSVLKLTTNGGRNASDGALWQPGMYGRMWTSSKSGDNYAVGWIYGNSASTSSGYNRGFGFGVRCIKDQ